MPIYEYRCPDGHTFEVFQRMADPPSEVCEVCGKAPVEKVLYPVAVHYKGSGFYSTDYGKGGRKAVASKDGDSSSSSSDGSGGKDSGSSSESGSSSSSSESSSKPAAAKD
jgi:putative FmdB family regulatory protein